MLLVDLAEKNGGNAERLHWLLSGVASHYPGVRDSERLAECWRQGDTLNLYATRDAGAMFATAFAYFSTPALRDEFKRRAPGLFDLMSEFVDRYENPPSGLESLQRYPEDGTDARRARFFADAMLMGSPSERTRRRIAQNLRFAPPRVLDLLHRHGMRILVAGPAGCGLFFPGQRVITIGTSGDAEGLMHEIGHALDHALLLEIAKHDPQVRRMPNLSEFIVDATPIHFFTQLGRHFPGRYPLADQLLARCRPEHAVSMYSHFTTQEWFAESFRNWRGAGATDSIPRLASLMAGDGTRASLSHRDPKFAPLLDEILERLETGMKIEGGATGPSIQPCARYEKDQRVPSMQRGLYLLKNYLLPVLIGLAIAAVLPFAGWLLGGITGLTWCWAAAVTIVQGARLLHQHYRVFDFPQKLVTAKVLAHSNDSVFARRADGRIIEVDRRLFSGFVDAPQVGQKICVAAKNSQMYAVTERQMKAQTRGKWLPPEKLSVPARSEERQRIDHALAEARGRGTTIEPSSAVARQARLEVAREAARAGKALNDRDATEPGSSNGRRVPRRLSRESISL